MQITNQMISSAVILAQDYHHRVHRGSEPPLTNDVMRYVLEGIAPLIDEAAFKAPQPIPYRTEAGLNAHLEARLHKLEQAIRGLAAIHSSDATTVVNDILAVE